MFCQKCGKEMPDDSVFCPSCGAKQIVAGQPEVKMEGAASKKKNLIMISVACGIFLVCLIIGLASLLIKPTVNLNKYIEISFDGYNTMGEVTVSFDKEQLQTDFGRKLKSSIVDRDEIA